MRLSILIILTLLSIGLALPCNQGGGETGWGVVLAFEEDIGTNVLDTPFEDLNTNEYSVLGTTPCWSARLCTVQCPYPCASDIVRYFDIGALFNPSKMVEAFDEICVKPRQTKMYQELKGIFKRHEIENQKKRQALRAVIKQELSRETKEAPSQSVAELQKEMTAMISLSERMTLWIAEVRRICTKLINGQEIKDAAKNAWYEYVKSKKVNAALPKGSASGPASGFAGSKDVGSASKKPPVQKTPAAQQGSGFSIGNMWPSSVLTLIATIQEEIFAKMEEIFSEKCPCQRVVALAKAMGERRDFKVAVDTAVKECKAGCGPDWKTPKDVFGVIDMSVTPQGQQMPNFGSNSGSGGKKPQLANPNQFN